MLIPIITELTKLSLISALLLLHSAASGFAILSVIRPEWNVIDSDGNYYLRWFFAISLGLMVNILFLFILGLTGYFNLRSVSSLGCLIFAIAVWRLFQRHQFWREIPVCWKYEDAVTLAVILTITVMAAMHAPGIWDDTMYHLPLARSYLQNEAFTLNEFLRFPLFPQNMNLFVALGLMFGGDLTAQVFATLPLFVIAIGLLGVSRWITGSMLIGILSVATLFLLKPLSDTLGYAYIDNGLALFCWGATLATALWTHSSQKNSAFSWLVIAGILMGGAVGTKYFALVLAALIAVYLAVGARNWKAAVIFGLMTFAAGSWWYIRSFLISGDPIHPAGGGLFGFFLWDAGDLAYQAREQATHGVPPATLNLWGALKIAGVLPWLFAIAGLVFRKRPAAIRFFQFIFCAYLAFWFFVTQVERYLAPIYATGTFLSWYTLYCLYRLIPSRITSRMLPTARSRLTQVSISSFIMAIVLLPLGLNQYRTASAAMHDWQTALEHRSGYFLFSEANKLIPQFGDRLVQIGFENAIYFFDETVIGDWFGPGRYRDIASCSEEKCIPLSPEQMRDVMEKFNARMLAISNGVFPQLNKTAYARQFDLVLQNHEGLLMTLKP